MQNASVNISTTDENVIELEYRRENSNGVYAGRNSNVESSYTVENLTFIANDSAERDEILSKIAQARAGGGQIYDEDTFFGSSCYIYISISYVSRTGTSGAEAKMTSVTVKYSTNSGTTISSKKLNLLCHGASASSGSIYKDRTLTSISSSPYTTSLPNSWPYVLTGSAVLGASFDVTATRPSGESKSSIVTAYVFLN